MKCRHCGYDIRPGEPGVRDWIHCNGFYQCPGLWDRGFAAEPVPGSTERGES